MINVKVVADSISGAGARITTLQLEYPRFIHSEFMTHRVFSRNASSSRAEPVAKRIEKIKHNPAKPVEWGLNKPGMQATEILSKEDGYLAEVYWLEARDQAVKYAEKLLKLNVHKQVVNRILEPFTHISVVCTATNWDNFFHLRLDANAQPEMRALAMDMLKALNESTPIEIDLGDWHLPYVRLEEFIKYYNQPDILLKMSTARCARVSYLTHDGDNPSVKADTKLYDRLIGDRPMHASPCEHQATPLKNADEYSRNFKGWLQHREIVEGYIDSEKCS